MLPCLILARSLRSHNIALEHVTLSAIPLECTLLLKADVVCLHPRFVAEESQPGTIDFTPITHYEEIRVDNFGFLSTLSTTVTVNVPHTALALQFLRVQSSSCRIRVTDEEYSAMVATAPPTEDVYILLRAMNLRRLSYWRSDDEDLVECTRTAHRAYYFWTVHREAPASRHRLDEGSALHVVRDVTAILHFFMSCLVGEQPYLSSPW